MDNNFTRLQDIETLVNNNKSNKYGALIGVFVAMSLSCFLIYIGFDKYNLLKVDSPHVVVTEAMYNNIASILLYASILVFISFTMWGTFTILLKVLRTEEELNAKLFKIQEELFKETQMWEITKLKKDKEMELKEKELEYKIVEFERLEKMKKEFEHNL